MVNYTKKSTEELEAIIRADAKKVIDAMPWDELRLVLEELERRRKIQSAECARRAFLEQEPEDDMIDPSTGILLTPGWQGKLCAGAGECCDECSYYLQCFPNWRGIMYEDI